MLEVLGRVISVGPLEGLGTKVNHMGGADFQQKPWTPRLGGLSWLAVFHLCCHTWLLGEISTVHTVPLVVSCLVSPEGCLVEVFLLLIVVCVLSL